MEGSGKKASDELCVEGQLGYKEIGSVMVGTTRIKTVESLEVARDAVLVRNQGTFLSDCRKNLLALAFPDLFPYGGGHPGSRREVTVSVEECCGHYLRLGIRQFAQHPTFGMVVFDLCAKGRVETSNTVRTKIQPGDFERLGGATREELAVVLEIQKRRREDANAGQVPIQQGKEGRRAVVKAS